MKRPSRFKRALLIVAATLVVIVVAVFLFFAYMLRDFPDLYVFDDEPFDAAAWKAAGGPSPERLVMSDDLIEKRLRPGMTRREVEELLGPMTPTDTDASWLGEVPSDEADALVYLLGVDFLDPCLLRVSFDAGGRLIASRRCCA